MILVHEQIGSTYDQHMYNIKHVQVICENIFAFGESFKRECIFDKKIALQSKVG